MCGVRDTCGPVQLSNLFALSARDGALKPPGNVTFRLLEKCG
jgi:hypothetical protein